MRRCLVVCTLLLFAPVAGANDGDVEQAHKLFRLTEYRQALQLLDRVLTSPSSRPRQIRQAYLLLGLCQAALGNPAKAEAAFARLLVLDPGYRLPGSYSPKLRPPFERARKRLGDNQGLRLEQRIEADPASGGWKLHLRLPENPWRMVRAVRASFSWGRRGEARSLVAPLDRVPHTVFTLVAPAGATTLYYHVELLNSHGATLKRIDDGGKPFMERLRKKPVAATAVPAATAARAAPAPTRPETTGAPVRQRDAVVAASAGSKWWQSWWFWTIVGVVVAGAATGTAVGLTASSGDSWPVRFQVEVR